jgi:hypothetical protein
VRSLAILLACSGCETVFPLDVDPDAPPVLECPPLVAGFDEDNDSVDDSVDTCPTIFNNQADDDDADGVGNLCDLHPGAGGVADSVVCFFPFRDPSELDRLRLGSDDWEVSNGSAIQGTAKGTDSLILPPLPAGATITVVASALADSMEDGKDPRLGAIVSGKNLGVAGMEEGIGCAVVHLAETTSPPTDQLELRHLETTENKQVSLRRDVDGVVISLSSFDPNGNPACAASQGLIPNFVELDNIASRSGEVAVFVQHSSVAIHSIVVSAPR